MTEDKAFELTPVDVRAQEFGKVLRGYNPDDVEDFKESMARELERHLREKSQIEERLVNFREQLKAFREREKAMNDALLAAQTLKAQMQETSEREAALVIKEARIEGDAIVARAREAEATLQRDLALVQRQFNTYVSSFRRLLERHLAEVDAIADYELDGTPPANPDDGVDQGWEEGADG